MPQPDPVTPLRLTPRQARFVDEYLVDLNGSKAAIRAGYTPRTARFQAARLLTKDNIKAAITKRAEARSRRTEITLDSVLKKVAEMAFTNLDAFVAWTGEKIELRPSVDIPPEQMGALQEIAETREGLRIKMADRMPALKLLFLHLAPLLGSKENPLHHDLTVKEAELDLSQLSDEQLRQFQVVLGALLDAQEITALNPR